MNLKQAQQHLASLQASILNLEVLDSSNPIITYDNGTCSWVSWRNAKNFRPFDYVSLEYVTLQNYLSILSDGQYMFLLKDGAIMQFSLQFDVNQKIIGQRFMYIPCPVEIGNTDRLDENQTIEDMVSNKFFTAIGSESNCDLEDIFDAISLRPSVRYEYDPTDGRVDLYHPLNHIHISSEKCRIHVSRLLTPLDFTRMIFHHYYSDIFYSNIAFRGYDDGSLRAAKVVPNTIYFTAQ